MPLTAQQAFNLGERLVKAGHAVDRAYAPNGVDWIVSVKKPDNNFWLIDENIPRVTPPEEA